MKQAQVAIDLGQRSSDEYEQVQYPPSDWQQQQNHPLYNKMSEEKARRRIPSYGPTDSEQQYNPLPPQRDMEYDYDSEGKDVYEKARPMLASSHRFKRAPPPRPTTLVRGTCSTLTVSAYSLRPRKNSSRKIWSTSHQPYTLYFRVIRDTTKLDMQI